MKKAILFIIVLVILLTGCRSKSEGVTYEDNIYFIMIDRFNDAVENLPDVDKSDPKAYQGGDIKGITEKLDYIKSLGMTAIWLTPVMDNAPRGYHGYWIYDFYSVDEHFGTLDDLKELVEKAHKRDMKVILDYVVNHMGEGTPWLDDPDKKDWFHENRAITNWSDKELVTQGWIYGLPDLNHENPEVSDYLMENAKWWIEETGIDGFRLDTVRHVPDEFWQRFISEIKEDYPNFYLLGEVWNHNARVLKVFQNLGMDGITNYSIHKGLNEQFTVHGNMKDFSKLIRDESVFSNPSLNSIFIDNHDNPRYFESGQEFSREYMEQALTFIYTYPAVTTFYYGTEAMLEGKVDPDNRKFMDWDTEGELVPYIRELAEIKAKYTGTFETIHYDRKLLAYKISNGKDSLLIIMNTDTKASSIEIPHTGKLRNYHTGNEFSTNDTLSLTLDAVSTVYFIID